LIATVIVVGPPERLIPAAEAIEHLGDVGVRAILISEGTHAEAVARVADTVVAVAGLAPNYLNNAVAALRLSSLPAAVWWRGGRPVGAAVRRLAQVEPAMAAGCARRDPRDAHAADIAARMRDARVRRPAHHPQDARRAHLLRRDGGRQ